MPPRDVRLMADPAALKKARKRANRRIAFLGHAVIYLGTCAFLGFVAGTFPMMVVALSWGIGLATHGFFWVVAPMLRERWITDEVAHRVETSVGQERRSLGEEHAREMHRLSASVAHEIRNPITAAKSLVQQMGEDPNAEQNVEYAKVAIEELDRVEKSIAHLLRYAREEALNPTQTSLRTIVETALETLKARTESVKLECELTEDDTLHGDPEALRRVVINLVSNALDALDEAAPNDPTIAIHSGQNLSGEMLWLAVRDNGCGIAPAQASEIFSPFHTSKDSGTGLGLAISKKLVEAHGGTLELNPSVSEGTELMLTLPRHRNKGDV